MEEKTIGIEPSKLKLKREVHEEEKLKIFFMFVKNDNTVPIGEQIAAIIAYRPQEAVSKAMQDYPGRNIFYQGQSVIVEDFIKQVYLLDKIEMNIENQPLGIIPPIDTKRLSKEQFKSGLLLVLDNFTKEEDKEALKSIIEKI